MLRTRNAIESLDGSMVNYARNVMSWRDGQMPLNWLATRATTRRTASENCAVRSGIPFCGRQVVT
jgi:hypothetical protein